MMDILKKIAAAAHLLSARFRSDARGNVAIMFAFASVAMVVGVGAGLDLSGAYSARQRLSQVAAMTCQYSVRQSVIDTQSSSASYATNPTNTFQTYLTAVNTFATTSLTAQHLAAASVTGPSGGSYFTATNGASGPINGVTDLTMAYQTVFLKIINVTSIPVHSRIGCAAAATAPQIISSADVLTEGFENTTCTNYCFTLPSGVSGALQNPTSTFGSTPTYTGSGGFAFYVIGYCLEVDAQGVINAYDPEGTHSAELDCDNASHTAGNSSLSTKVFLNAGNYELRYFYRSRVQYPDYDPFYICGATLSETNWANDTNAVAPFTGSLRTNQMNVYLDATTSVGLPPLHYTTYALSTPTQQLAGSNLIDACVYSYKWVERSVTINVTGSSYFWLSFAADGANDSYGAQLDDIRLCPGTCAGTPQDNFPSNTPQTQPVLADQSYALAADVSSQSTWGWNTYLSGSGTLITPLCGATVIATSFSSCVTNPTRTAATNVMLDPGFYELSYQYLSLATFTGAPVTGCNSKPLATDVASTQSAAVTAKDPRVLTSNTYATKADVDMVGTFLSFPTQTLTPNIGGSVTLANPLIDLCYYSTTAVTRKIGMQITKSGLYNLAYYAAGTATSKYLGGAVGSQTSMTLTALGSPFTLATSANCPPVPVPDPQVGTAQTPTSGTGFTTTSTDPFPQGASTTACAPQ